MVRGRPIDIDLALSQDDARTLAAGKSSARAAKDNRNLYLVWILCPPLSAPPGCAPGHKHLSPI
jgi:hypothetical protein